MDDKNIPMTDFSGLADSVNRMKSEIKKIIVGQDEVIDLMITALLASGHILIEGVPGTAKTLLAKILARTISCDFARIQFTPDLMPSDVIGTTVYNVKTSDFEFRRGPVFANIVLIDEINRAPAKTQAALFEVMEERQISYDAATYLMKEPFIVLATQNPVEHEGTYRLPEAELDRFLFKIDIAYTKFEEEVDMLMLLHNRENSNDLTIINPVIGADELLKHRQLIRQIHIEKNLAEYTAKIINGTRQNKDISLGGSPRAALAVLAAAKSWAAMQGRDFISPDDICHVILPVLRHRILISAEKEMEGMEPDEILRMIIDKIEVPR